MDTVRIVLKGIFTFVLYPAMVLALFSFIVIFIARIVSEGKGLSSRVRRLTGASLPVVVLIFVLVLVTEQGDEPIKRFIVSIPSVIHLLIGGAVGLGFIEIGRLLMRRDDDTGPSVYNLFLSSVGVFVLYSVMQGILGNLNYFLFGLIMVGGIDVIFKGPPWDVKPIRKRHTPP